MRIILPLVILLGGLTVLLLLGLEGSVGGIQAGQFAAAVSLAAIGIWIGMGAFHGTALSENLRNLALWAGIFLILGLAYAYRFEFADMRDRLVSSFVPGSAISSLNDDGQIQVATTRIDNGQFVLTGQVGSADVRFLVDTGASAVVLTASDAQSVGVDVEQLRFTIPVSTAGGLTRAAQAEVPTLRIGDIERQNLQVLVSQPGDLRTSLLGMTFLNTLSAFTFERDRLILTD
ncbi:MAG: TIGR02281 family clan AA aspartic protease [Pseudomonadota bacterium]